MNYPQRPHNTINASRAVKSSMCTHPGAGITGFSTNLSFPLWVVALFPKLFCPRLGRRPESVDNRQFIPNPPPINILQQCSKCTDRVCGDVCAGQNFLMTLSTSFRSKIDKATLLSTVLFIPYQVLLKEYPYFEWENNPKSYGFVLRDNFHRKGKCSLG